MNFPGNRLRAFGAGLAFFSINGEADRKIALRSVWIEKIPQSGTAAGNTFIEDITNAIDPFFPLGKGNFTRLFGGTNSRMV